MHTQVPFNAQPFRVRLHHPPFPSPPAWACRGGVVRQRPPSETLTARLGLGRWKRAAAGKQSPLRRVPLLALDVAGLGKQHDHVWVRVPVGLGDPAELAAPVGEQIDGDDPVGPDRPLRVGTRRCVLEFLVVPCVVETKQSWVRWSAYSSVDSSCSQGIGVDRRESVDGFNLQAGPPKKWDISWIKTPGLLT